MTLDRAQVAGMLPHDGSMMLIDQVERWSEAEITCRTASHRLIDNPLRSGNQLTVFCGIEYGAQAMAIHGALIGDGEKRQGLLASLKGVNAHVDRLDNIEGDLIIHARLLLRQRMSFIYDFSVSAGDAKVLTGQASVFLT